MTRRLLAALFVTVAAFALTVRADVPKKPDAPSAVDPKVQEQDAAAKEKILREQFETFKNEVLKLKQRLETSDKDEDKNTVKVLEDVLREINNQAVDGKFDKVIERLGDPDTFKKIQDAGEVASGNKELHDAMLKLIDILQNGDDFAIRKKERLANEKLLEKLKEILSQQERLTTRIDRAKGDSKDLAKMQKRIEDATKGTLDPNAGKETKPDFKKSEAKYDNKPGEGDKRGEAKNDTQGPKGAAKDDKEGDAKEAKPGANKDGDNKDGMKPGDGKQGDNKDGMKPSDGKGGENKDGMKPGEGKEGDKGGEAKNGDKPSDGKGGEAKNAKPGEGKEAGKPGEGDKKEGKPGENKDGKGGDSKDGKSGEAKDGAKSGMGESKPGAGKDGKGGEGKDSKAGEGKAGAKSGSNPSDKPGEGKEASKAGGANPKSADGKPGAGKEGGKPGDAKPGETKAGQAQGNVKPGEGKGNEAKAAAGSEPGKVGKPGAGKPGAGDGKPGKPGEGKEGAKPGAGKPGDAKAGASKDGKPGDGKSGDGKPSESKSGSDQKGQGDGKGKAKAGDPKSGMNPDGKPSASKGNPSAGQPSQSKPGEGKSDSGDSSASPPPPPQGPQMKVPVRKQIEDGQKDMEETKNKLNQDDKPGALKPGNKAADDIAKAIKKLEEIINADRQEEIERILERLQARCARMLAMQIAVKDGTLKVDEKLQEVRKDKGDERPLALDSNVLSDREYDIVKEADRALALLESDGSAQAFAEMFQMVRRDMLTVKDHLGQTDTGAVTQGVEDEIIRNLTDMVEALKKQREANKNKGPKQPPMPGQPQQKGEDPLVDIIAQLKLLRSMQKGVQDRTGLYHKEYDGEQAPAPDAAKDSKQRKHYEMIQKEMKELADNEARISKILKDMLTGKDRAD